MTKTKELVSSAILILIAASFVSVYFLNHRSVSVTAPSFVFEEVIVQKTAAKAVPMPLKPAATPLPLTPPRLISQVLPLYPEAALKAGVEGIVVVAANVGLDGFVFDVQAKATSGNGELDASALAAVRQWRFSPALQGGSSVASVFEVPVRFAIK